MGRPPKKRYEKIEDHPQKDSIIALDSAAGGNSVDLVEVMKLNRDALRIMPSSLVGQNALNSVRARAFIYVTYVVLDLNYAQVRHDHRNESRESSATSFNVLAGGASIGFIAVEPNGDLSAPPCPLPRLSQRLKHAKDRQRIAGHWQVEKVEARTFRNRQIHCVGALHDALIEFMWDPANVDALRRDANYVKAARGRASHRENTTFHLDGFSLP